MSVVLICTAINGVEPVPGTPAMRASVTMTKSQREAAAAALLGSMKHGELLDFLRAQFPEFVREEVAC